MRLNYSDPGKLAFGNALILMAISLLLNILVVVIFYTQLLLWPVIGVNILIALLVFFLFRYTIEKFIYEKIKIIYKTIRNLKLPKEGDRPSIKGAALDKVNQEVIEWSETKKQEIEELKKMARYRREFLGNVSHELKTPIFNIQGYVLTLLDGGLDDPSINKEYLLRTEKSINRMIAIVEDLETISQLEASELKLNTTKFDIVALTREVIEFLEIKSKKRDKVIGFDRNYDKPILVLADKERIRQGLVNLIANLIKKGNPGHRKTKISFFDMDENTLIEITDNGNGIDAADLPRVFERFFRTDKGRSREQGGTGLGLAIVKHIIEAHDQTINVRSTVGVGTTFAFTLKKV